MSVDDHVNAYLLAMKSEKATIEVFNVSPSNLVTNEKFTSLLPEIIGFNGKIVFRSYPPSYPSRPIAQDTDYLVLDSTKIRETIGARAEEFMDIVKEVC
jgi:nucleoside-diphosphate-sugar epimerase